MALEYLPDSQHWPILADSAEKARSALAALSKTVLDGLRPPAGAYAFFNHNSYAISRVEDCKLILYRLCRGRVLLSHFTKLADAARPAGHPAGVPFPDEMRRNLREEDWHTSLMKLDLESLYVFGTALLDSWALQAIATQTLPLKGLHPFVELTHYLEDNPQALCGLWPQMKSEMLWLHFQLRFYRNKFVVHANRPWQRGTTRSSYGHDFNLHTPSPPGWLNDERLDQEIRALIGFAPDHIQKAPDNYWERSPGALIERIFNNIGSVSRREDRERIARVFAKKGGSTPSYEILGKRLLDFVAEGSNRLAECAEVDLARVDLGKPHSTSREMHERWLKRQEPEDAAGDS